jgi:hypothetical protein
VNALTRSCLILLALFLLCPVGVQAGGPGEPARRGEWKGCEKRRAVEIDQAKALAGRVTPSDTPGFPVTIDRPGCYRLTGSLQLPDPRPSVPVLAVEILASHVSLDLGGFEILCSGTFSCVGYAAIRGSDDAHRVSVTNGRIASTDPSGNGLDFASVSLPGRHNRVHDIQIPGAKGVQLGDDCTLTDSAWGGGQNGSGVGDRCVVERVAAGGSNGGGLAGGDGVHVSDSTFRFSDNSPGLLLGRNARVRNVVAERNFEAGIEVGEGSIVRGCEVSRTFGPGIRIASGRVSHCVVERNRGCGIEATDGTRIIANRVVGNESEGLCADETVRYTRNLFADNFDECLVEGGSCPTGPEVSGGTEVGRNQCGDDFVCP